MTDSKASADNDASMNDLSQLENDEGFPPHQDLPPIRPPLECVNEEGGGAIAMNDQQRKRKGDFMW